MNEVIVQAAKQIKAKMMFMRVCHQLHELILDDKELIEDNGIAPPLLREHHIEAVKSLQEIERGNLFKIETLDILYKSYNTLQYVKKKLYPAKAFLFANIMEDLYGVIILAADYVELHGEVEYTPAEEPESIIK